MRVVFRTYCYGCRRGQRWNGCVWPEHRYEWEYWIHCGGRRLVQRGQFRSYDRAWESAQRSWFKLAAVECIDVPVGAA